MVIYLKELLVEKKLIKVSVICVVRFYEIYGY